MRSARGQLRIQPFLPVLLVQLLVPVACTTTVELEEFSFSGPTMGTVFHVTVVDTVIEAQTRAILPVVVDSVLSSVNASMSTYLQDSEISRFNRASAQEGFALSPGFQTVVGEALLLCDSSGGAFDVTVAPFVNFYGFGFEPGQGRFPTVEEIDSWLELTGCDRLWIEDDLLYKSSDQVSIDLSAIAKGFGADQVHRKLHQLGYDDVFVEVGGEVVTSGNSVQGTPWRVGIDRPSFSAVPGEALQHVLAISGLGVATSGDYRNYREVDGQRISHTIDPRTGYPLDHNLASTTIIAGNCIRADGLATAVMVMGLEEGQAWVEAMPGVEALLIIRTGPDQYEEHMTSGFANYLYQ